MYLKPLPPLPPKIHNENHYVSETPSPSQDTQHKYMTNIFSIYQMKSGPIFIKKKSNK